ncbi:hypothetical protein M3P05_04520 [Sansalvadorimonas sp. 2012CJ34-2]|uniref:DAGKc domain-containing protein n=1 Tax=Parendozoicomonas callyspongiae TaxID=2942213 RepID=A0ABT0PCU8_9GAMM|nr:diacylglycerol kinase family protein [Sansalvadorimonas sp. 2012CJ34-2]MCL6269208.1 hypothetical protein [Sansalvadorimonas sp. 2012CJ34-2]
MLYKRFETGVFSRKIFLWFITVLALASSPLEAGISHVCFIVNGASNSGRCASTWMSIHDKYVRKLFIPKDSMTVASDEELTYEVAESSYPGAVPEIAERLYDEWESESESDDDQVLMVAVGGDGTVSEVVQNLHGKKNVVFSVLPCGTGNDIARTLGIPFNLKKALDIIRWGGRTVSYGAYRIQADRLGEGGNLIRKYAVDEFDLGVCADGGLIKYRHDRNIRERPVLNWIPRFLKYPAITLLSLMNWKARKVHVALDELSRENFNLGMILGGCGPTVGGGQRFFPAMKPESDKGAMLIEPSSSRFQILWDLLHHQLGRRMPGSKMVEFTNAAIRHEDGESPILLQYDGEPVLQTPAEITWLPGAFRFLGKAK